jgi:excisionase family DNA binding protein
MPDSERTPPAGYLTTNQARERLGVSRMTMYRMMRRQNVPMYADPRDARVKLVRTEDIDRLMQPVPLKMAA